MAEALADEALRRLELTITRRLDGILQGDYRGLVPGHGSEPGEARRYQPGDDVRRMDWNVTARTREPHVREQVADRELEAWLCVDCSARLDVGDPSSALGEKREAALAAAAGVGFLTARAGNRVGAVIRTEGGLTVLPARQGRKHLMAILATVRDAPRMRRTTDSLSDALDRVARLARRRGFVCVVSDFSEPPSEWQHSLSLLHQRHEVLCAEIVDPWDLDLPDLGIIVAEDPATGRTIEIDTSQRRTRERYAAGAAEQRGNIASAIRAAGADHLVLRTDRDWLEDLIGHVARRRHRAAYMGAAR